MKFNVAQVVWGEHYIDLLVNVVLPSQLAPGNLPVFQGTGHEVVYKIYTTTIGAHSIAKSPAYVRLCTIIRAEFVSIDRVADFDRAMSPEEKYHAMSECHRMAIEDAAKNKAAIIFVSPDCLQSDGTFSSLLRLSASGKRAVVMPALRVVRETFVPQLLSEFRDADGAIRISSRDLVKLSCAHWHPLTLATFVDASSFNSAASNLYWKVPGQGVLARCFHLSVFMVIPHEAHSSFSQTIDGDYLRSACPAIEDIHVVEDSDEIMCIEMSSRAYTLVEDKALGFHPFRVARRMKPAVNSQHLAFLSRRIRLHANDLSPRWSEAERESDRAVESILYWLKSGGILLWQPKPAIRRALVWVLGEQSTRQLIRRIRSLYQRVVK